MVSRPAGWMREAVNRGGIRRKPVRSLPSRLLAEACAKLLQPRVGGGEAQWPARFALLIRIVDVVVRRVDLDGSRESIGLATILTAEPAQVHLPQVEARLAIDDPFSHGGAHPSGTGDPMGAEPRRDIETPN